MIGKPVRLRHLYEQHIGDADGRIALWLNELSAHDLVAMMRSDDLGAIEIEHAIARAYPRCRHDNKLEHGCVECDVEDGDV